MIRLFLQITLILVLFRVSAQIVDDSTKQIYGPKTTTFIHPYQVKNNLMTYRTIDTSIYRFEQQTFPERNKWEYQNLGNFGTAIFDSYYRPQEDIGRTSGINAFKPFFKQSDSIKFYDTKSPFIELETYLGGNNRNFVDFGFSQNIKPHWNFGFNLNLITSDKQIARQSRGDRQVVSNSYSVYTHYEHPKKPYQLLFSYSRLQHKVIEYGGVRFGEDSLRSDYFQYRNSFTRIDNAENTTQETTGFLYHDYQLTNALQFYHELRASNEAHTYIDFQDIATNESYNSYTDFYNEFLIDNDSTYERVDFMSTSNELGIKGDLSSFFYRAYIKLRSVDVNYAFTDPSERIIEEYIGGYARFNWKNQFQITADGEFLAGGEYKLNGNLRNKLINLKYSTKKYNIPFIYNNYFGNHGEWENSFKPVFANTLAGNLNMQFGNLEVRPKISFISYGNFIFFNENIRPQQIAGTTLLTTFGSEFNLRFGSDSTDGFHIENDIRVSASSGAARNEVRMPPIHYNGRLFFRGKWFENSVPVETGVGLTSRVSYFANGYDPVTKQFYVQNEQDIFSFWRADLFLNMKLTNFYLAFKFNYVNQPGDSGYFSTPFYPAASSSMDIIVRWLFFD